MLLVIKEKKMFEIYDYDSDFILIYCCFGNSVVFLIIWDVLDRLFGESDFICFYVNR